MISRTLLFAGFTLIAVAVLSAQSESDLMTIFRDAGNFTTAEIATIREGKGVAKVLTSRSPSEIFVLGATFIRAEPESYVAFATDLDRMRNLSEYLAVGTFGNPPKVADLKGFTLDKEDIESLRKCKPRDCEIQMPGDRIAQVQKEVHWSSPAVADEVNQLLQRSIVDRLIAYQKAGNRALGEYNDKENPTVVSRHFETMLGFAKAMPHYTPELHRYLLEYPAAKPAGVEEMVRWEKVKFGLKPTLRLVHVLIAKGRAPMEPAYTVVGKQLYASHYFETALDVAYLVRSSDPGRPGFYLVLVMGSEQDGLTGIKGSVVRNVVVGRTASSLEKSLNSIKTILESTSRR